MGQFEQLVCGTSPENPGQGRTVLARSPGMGGSVTEEIVKYCVGWGTPVSGDFNRPAVLSFPLATTMPAIRGQLFAVVRVAPADPLLFHAVVMSRTDFRDFGYNPFAVVDTGIFMDSWPGGMPLAKGQLPPATETARVSPPPGEGDIGLVDEALLLILTKGKLILDLEAATAESDRVLHLLIEALPLSRRETLRFASFAPPGENQYQLAASYARSTPFAGWRRLFLTMLDYGTTAEARSYVETVRTGLRAGSLAGVNIRLNPVSPGHAASSPKSRPVVEPLVAGPTVATPARQAPPSGGTRPTAAAVIPSPVASLATRRPGLSRPSMVGPRFDHSRPEPSRLVRQPVSMGRPPRRRRSPALAIFVVILAMLAGGWVYLDRSGKGREWGIFDLANLGGREHAADKAPSLLDVVDVSRNYQDQLRRIQRGKLMPGADRDQALRRAQAKLLAEAAGPLLVQVEMYLQLAAEGIQQGHRPDREKARLVSLDNRGQVLAAEMGRLELAYYSFAQGVLWQDLHLLRDSEVAARRDSLQGAAGKLLAGASRDVGTEPFWRPVQAASRNVTGMASLLTLFQAPSWSASWEQDLKRAAEMVSPTASPMSRAYRNNAFTLIRLKHAEHHAANQALIYGSEFLQGKWASAAVRDILPELRRRASLFGANEMPDLLAGTLHFYAQLEDPSGLAARLAEGPDPLKDLQANPAVAFDPAVYGAYLDRLRFEALAMQLDQGLAATDLAPHLTAGLDPTEVLHFRQIRREGGDPEQWRELAGQAGESFLGRWAKHNAASAQQQRLRSREDFDRAWQASRQLGLDLADRAAQGQDWTTVWVDLDHQLQQALAAGRGLDPADLARGVQRDQAAAWRFDLAVPRPLEIQNVVVRLNQDQLTGPAEVQVELQVGSSGQVLPGRMLRLGPAAPAGTGWVGTVNLDWQADVSPNDGLTAVVRMPGGRVLLEAPCASLAERMGPGALTRPLRTEAGSLVFEVSDQWWRTLPITQIP